MVGWQTRATRALPVRGRGGTARAGLNARGASVSGTATALRDRRAGVRGAHNAHQRCGTVGRPGITDHGKGWHLTRERSTGRVAVGAVIDVAGIWRMIDRRCLALSTAWRIHNHVGRRRHITIVDIGNRRLE